MKQKRIFIFLLFLSVLVYSFKGLSAAQIAQAAQAAQTAPTAPAAQIAPAAPIASAAQATPATQAADRIVLAVGESYRLRAPLGASAWLSTGRVISLREQNLHFVLQAKKTGEVLLNVNHKLYRVQVLSRADKQKWMRLNQFLQSRKGLTLQVSKGEFYINGQLLRIKDFKDLVQFCQTQNITYFFQTKVPVALQAPLKQFLKQQFFQQQESLHILWEEQPLAILLPARHPHINFYKRLFKNQGIVIKEDSSLMAQLPSIELQLLLVESSRNSSFQIRKNWGSPFVSRLLKPKLFQEILSSLQAMEQKGLAHILSQATLLTEHGKEARFHSGGEVPIPDFHPETGQATIKWKPYGIQLSFESKTDWNNNIHIQVQAETSEVDHSQSASTSPSIRNNKINTSLVLRDGQTIALTTLVRRQGGKSFSAPLPVSRLPLAGEFLSLKGKLKERTSLSIFITANLKKESFSQ